MKTLAAEIAELKVQLRKAQSELMAANGYVSTLKKELAGYSAESSVLQMKLSASEKSEEFWMKEALDLAEETARKEWQ